MTTACSEAGKWTLCEKKSNKKRHRSREHGLVPASSVSSAVGDSILRKVRVKVEVELSTIQIILLFEKKHSSCEIEDFVETHLCKLCVILRSRVLRVVCPH